MATKAQIKKAVKTVRAKAATPVAGKVKTISVGGPAPVKTVNVLGINFEQGNDFTFGKCVRKNARGGNTGQVYHFLKVSNAHYLLWEFQPPDGYFNYYSAQDPNFTNQYMVVDWDTPTLAPQGGALLANEGDYGDYYDDEIPF